MTEQRLDRHALKALGGSAPDPQTKVDTRKREPHCCSGSPGDGCVYTTLQQPLPVLLERNSSVFSTLQELLVGLEPLIGPAHLLSSGSAEPTVPDGSRKTKGREEED